MKRKSRYATMKASDLARETRERGLDKPNVITLSEWADFLEADDVKRAKQAQESSVKGDGKGHKLPDLTPENADEEKAFDPADADRDTEDAAPAKTDAADKPAKKGAR